MQVPCCCVVPTFTLLVASGISTQLAHVSQPLYSEDEEERKNDKQMEMKKENGYNIPGSVAGHSGLCCGLAEA